MVPYTYYRLCESYREVDGKVKQRTVLGLGELLEFPTEAEKKELSDLLTSLINEGTGGLCGSENNLPKNTLPQNQEVSGLMAAMGVSVVFLRRSPCHQHPMHGRLSANLPDVLGQKTSGRKPVLSPTD